MKTKNNKQSRIKFKVTPIAAEALTRTEIDHIIETACQDAFSQSDWKPGKCYRLNFTKNGRGFSIALDNKPEGFVAMIGLPQDIHGPWPYPKDQMNEARMQND